MISTARVWPGLRVGDMVSIRLGGGGRAHGMVLLIEDDGALGLAVPPAAPRGRWRPRWVLRQQVQALWSSTSQAVGLAD